MVKSCRLCLRNKPRDVPIDDRRVLNDLLWWFWTGSPWTAIPERYGPSTTCYSRFVHWPKAGVWDRLFEAYSAAYDGDVTIDSTCVHQHATTGKRGMSDGGIGRSRVSGKLRPFRRRNSRA